ncbi:Kp4-domain-containing protein [Apodospora peruviana]|uniref:Kp4-domain-containing protein n=1 Tax=Apodospora peruviana TaxID=516989 RepID=A0AAE0HVT3_9PEZI|nr:Kp4-domain-containing protein [Apodospora peruviana]
MESSPRDIISQIHVQKPTINSQHPILTSAHLPKNKTPSSQEPTLKMVSFSTLANTIAVAAAAMAGLTSALGINCEGSGGCVAFGMGDELQSFKDVASQIPNRQYQNGEHIACNDGFCLFLQGTGFGAPGSSIPPLIDALLNHNCKTCGSVPIFFPQGSNDPSAGILTSNFVNSVDGCVSNGVSAQICQPGSGL